MKIFAFIMAVVVLALSIMPCADDANAMNGSKAKTELTKSPHQKDSSQSEACSPFCQCSCCAGFSINHLVAAITSIPQYGGNPTSSFLPANVREVALPIWQPPQLV